MFRRLLGVIGLGAASTLSLGFAQVGTSVDAGAAGGGASTTCHFGGWVNVDLLAQGHAKKGKNAIWVTSGGPVSCSGKHAGPGQFVSDDEHVSNTMTCSNDPNPPVICPAGDYVYSSALEFTSQLSTVTGNMGWVIGTTSYDESTMSSAAATTGLGPGECPSGEYGYVLSGHLLKASGKVTAKSALVTICFSGDSGSGTTNNFSSDLAAEIGGDTMLDIFRANLDPAATSIVFS
jgi:hypothetical protein